VSLHYLFVIAGSGDPAYSGGLNYVVNYFGKLSRELCRELDRVDLVDDKDYGFVGDREKLTTKIADVVGMPVYYLVVIAGSGDPAYSGGLNYVVNYLEKLSRERCREVDRVDLVDDKVYGLVGDRG